jgi:hypothetical protein
LRLARTTDWFKDKTDKKSASNQTSEQPVRIPNSNEAWSEEERIAFADGIIAYDGIKTARQNKSIKDDPRFSYIGFTYCYICVRP